MRPLLKGNIPWTGLPESLMCWSKNASLGLDVELIEESDLGNLKWRSVVRNSFSNSRFDVLIFKGDNIRGR